MFPFVHTAAVAGGNQNFRRFPTGKQYPSSCFAATDAKQ